MHIPLLHEALSCLQHTAFKTSAILRVSELSEWLTIGIWKENSRQLRLVLAIWFMEVFYDRTMTLRQNQHTFGNLNQAGVWPGRDLQLSYLPKFWNRSIGRVRPIHIGIISFSISQLQTSWVFSKISIKLFRCKREISEITISSQHLSHWSECFLLCTSITTFFLFRSASSGHSQTEPVASSALIQEIV